MGVDPSRLAIAGQSAGGGLAAATALLARDRGGPKLCFQLLEIPELDDRLETPSMRAFTDTPLWNHPNAVSSWRHYLGPDHQGEVSPYAAPARAVDLSGLPPILIHVGDDEILLDDALRLHKAARAADTQATVEVWTDMIHVWHWFHPRLSEGRDAIAEVGRYLRRHWD